MFDKNKGREFIIIIVIDDLYSRVDMELIILYFC